MNTYLVPVKEEYQSKFTFIVVVYANTEKEAYNAVIEWKGLMPFIIQKYTDVPYESYEGELSFPEKFFAIKRKHNILKKVLSLLEDDTYMDARLIAKPESNCLIAENITEE